MSQVILFYFIYLRSTVIICTIGVDAIVIFQQILRPDTK